jgi:hypothetical protein
MALLPSLPSFLPSFFADGGTIPAVTYWLQFTREFQGSLLEREALRRWEGGREQPASDSQSCVLSTGSGGGRACSDVQQKVSAVCAPSTTIQYL